MDFNDTTEQAQFRKTCREWLEKNAEPKSSSSRESFSDIDFLEVAKQWQKKKYDAGWAMLHWPKEYGGIAASPIERIIWAEEESKFNVPRGIFEIGLGMCGPVMMEYATDEQKERFLPSMAEGTEIWCQLFSEPSAGSDVAGLRSKAAQDGDNWIINGQKVWTSGAHFCDYGILVVRHDPNLEKHKGMTFFFVDMKSPGIEVKPIKQITGGSSFNEVYFTDVVIPDSQRLGAIGDGWKVAITTLMNERLAVGDANGADVKEAFNWAKKQDDSGEYLINNRATRESIADWYCEANGLKNTKLRTMSALSKGETPGPEASITKIVSANKLQDIGNFGIDSLDMAGMLKPENNEIQSFQNAWLGAPGLRIAGGTDEILKNIISERVLGLPQDPRADKGLPFKDIPSGN
ncbi:acyl-CoA dehydrogenase family protein [Gammaproteobacteria bacterium]|nr:acyl-CoA dehydrogenase family protein [Gammaproteobacteria bacterium]MDA7709671.1 acyl-CoA dehydrogenase family protein [Gammaproteobacteria bacterium]MDA8808952.1 acyl-CoA dehydrogenase family protein [Gammaproteobacteria bacterium]MDA8899786.1 acyl-CoA dehydrogenase family protein [Gammaproteobacteria bacterium]MDA8929343.1 acyl-CoA dehydrogenase family protein [Gammaproteobacteria bacterium]